MMKMVTHYGGALGADTGAVGAFTWDMRVRVFTLATSVACAISLPTAIGQKVGGFHLIMLNVGGSVITIKDADGNTIATVPASDSAFLSLVDNSTQAGVWIARIGDIQGSAAA